MGEFQSGGGAMRAYRCTSAAITPIELHAQVAITKPAHELPKQVPTVASANDHRSPFLLVITAVVLHAVS